MALKLHRYHHGLQLLWAYPKKTPHELEFISYGSLISLTEIHQTICTSSVFELEGTIENRIYFPIAKRIGNTIEITYKEMSGTNEDIQCEAGITKIYFEDSKLQKVLNVEWNSENKLEPVNLYKFKYINKPSFISDSKKSKRLTFIWDRREQARLKSEILPIDRDCLVSNCSVADVLQVAHIRPVHAKGSDLLENAILLRADIHILFDKNLVKIDSNSGRISIDNSVESYFKFHQLNNYIDEKILVRVKEALKWREKNYM